MANLISLEKTCSSLGQDIAYFRWNRRGQLKLQMGIIALEYDLNLGINST